VLAKSAEPDAHDKVLTITQVELKFGNVVVVVFFFLFEERGKPEFPEKNLSEQGREPPRNSTLICRRVR